jgi:hypothetical protein
MCVAKQPELPQVCCRPCGHSYSSGLLTFPLVLGFNQILVFRPLRLHANIPVVSALLGAASVASASFAANISYKAMHRNYHDISQFVAQARMKPAAAVAEEVLALAQSRSSRLFSRSFKYKNEGAASSCNRISPLEAALPAVGGRSSSHCCWCRGLQDPRRTISVFFSVFILFLMHQQRSAVQSLPGRGVCSAVRRVDRGSGATVHYSEVDHM